MNKAGNTIADLVESQTDALYRRAFYKLSDEELAKDIVQETFISAFLKWETFEGKSNPQTWLFSILNNKIADHYRRQFRSPVETGLNNENNFFDNDGMWLEDKKPKECDYDIHLLDNPEFLKILDSCMEKLPRQWSAAVKLKYLLEKDGNEICKELNISATNYWQLIRRAKLNLRQCLELNWFR